jgi:hypothetical protein
MLDVWIQAGFPANKKAALLGAACVGPSGGRHCSRAVAERESARRIAAEIMSAYCGMRGRLSRFDWRSNRLRSAAARVNQPAHSLNQAADVARQSCASRSRRAL